MSTSWVNDRRLASALLSARMSYVSKSAVPIVNIGLAGVCRVYAALGRSSIGNSPWIMLSLYEDNGFSMSAEKLLVVE